MHKTKPPKVIKAKKEKTGSNPTIVKKLVKKTDLENFSKIGQEQVIEKPIKALPVEGGSGKKLLSMLIEGKKSAKGEIYSALGKENKLDLKTPLVLIFATDLNGDKELFPREALFKLLEGLLVLNTKIIVIDTEQRSDLNNLSELTEHQNGQITWYNPKQDNSGHGREEKEIDRLLLAADMALIFNNHLQLIQLLMNYGIVIVGEEKSPFLENYRPNEETGNSFLFKKRDLWSVFACLVRALETHKFPYDWNHIVRQICKSSEQF